MAAKILIIHGPNLNLLGERRTDDPAVSLASLDARLRRRAVELGVSLKVVQSNHEGAILDVLYAERAWADALILNPGALAATAFSIREAISELGLLAIEVHLKDPLQEPWKRSVIADACSGQVAGKGPDGYLLALERLARVDRLAREAPPKTLGRKPPSLTLARVGPPSATPPRGKTLGRAASTGKKGKATAGQITRAIIRERIAERLSGKVSASGLSTWARGQWLEVQRGAAAESGHRELLEEVLQRLVVSNVPPSRLSDDQLIELMADLER